MKRFSSIHPFMVALCILVVFGILASISAVFPSEGITLRYPSYDASSGSTEQNSRLSSLSASDLSPDFSSKTSFDLTTRHPFELTFRVPSPATLSGFDKHDFDSPDTPVASPSKSPLEQEAQYASAANIDGTIASSESETGFSIENSPATSSPNIAKAEDSHSNLSPNTSSTDTTKMATDSAHPVQLANGIISPLALPYSTYFDSLFFALQQADQHRVRIVHFGDSQLEEDRMSCDLRLALQQRFGGGGNGLLPWQHELYSQTTLLTSPVKPKQHMIYGPKGGRRPNSSMYGPMGKVSLIDSTMTVTIAPKKRDGKLTSTHFFNQLTVLTYSNSDLRLRAQNQSVTIEPNSVHLQRTIVNLEDSTSSLRITLSGQGDVYGFMLDNQTGVSVDNIPMRGCSGTVFTSLDARQLYGYLHTDEVKLIILQFGGNSVPYLKDSKGISNYVEQLRRQLQLLRRIAPQAAFLWVGPSDMTTRVNGRMATYPSLEQIDATLCQMVLDEGCAYFSLFQAMGGPGSMVRWVEQSPALACKDYIHFTRRGATRAGQLLTDAILSSFPDSAEKSNY